MRFSVIIPVFQGSAFVRQAVESALEQTHPPHEVIVVDDGSTDDPAGALGPLVDRIVFLQQPNRGVSAARNLALSRATGDWAVLLDHDDYWAPGRLEAMARHIDGDPGIGLVTTDAVVVDELGSAVGRYYEKLTFHTVKQREALLRQNFVFVGAAFPLKSAQRLGGFDEDLSGVQDYDLWLRLALAGARIGLVDEPLASYRVHASNMSHDVRAMSAERRRVLAMLLDRDDLAESERTIILSKLAARPSASTDAALIREALAVGGRVRGPGIRLALRSDAPTALRLKGALTAVSPWIARRVSRQE